MGDRPTELSSAVASIRAATVSEQPEIVVIHNGSKAGDLEGVRSVELPSNQGIPGGRHTAMRLTNSDVVFFLDDDARVVGNWPSRVLDDFRNNDRIAAVSTRIVDERGRTLRRHVPRLGSRGLTDGGPSPRSWEVRRRSGERPMRTLEDFGLNCGSGTRSRIYRGDFWTVIGRFATTRRHSFSILAPKFHATPMAGGLRGVTVCGLREGTCLGRLRRCTRLCG